MAKRHHQSERSRYHEYAGEERHLHGYHKGRAGHYEGHSERRRQEMEDAGMIHEDLSAIANLPQNVMIKPYPVEKGYLPESLDDTISGVDRQMGRDNSKKMQDYAPKKV